MAYKPYKYDPVKDADDPIRARINHIEDGLSEGGSEGPRGPKGDKGATGDKGDKGDPGEVTQAAFDALEARVAALENTP